MLRWAMWWFDTFLCCEIITTIESESLYNQVFLVSLWLMSSSKMFPFSAEPAPIKIEEYKRKQGLKLFSSSSVPGFWSKKL